MRPKQPAAEPQEDLFRARLENLVDPRHPLVRLAGLIDWGRFERTFGALYTEGVGRPGPADAADGRAAPAQAHGRPVRRGDLRPLPRQPLRPAVLRRDLFPARPAARPLIDDALAPAHRRRAAGGAAGREPGRRTARRRGGGEASAARHRRHHGAAQGGDAPDRQQTPAPRHRDPGAAGPAARHPAAAVLSAGGRAGAARGRAG